MARKLLSVTVLALLVAAAFAQVRLFSGAAGPLARNPLAATGTATDIRAGYTQALLHTASS